MSNLGTPDFAVENHGSVVLVRLHTAAARDWVETNLDLEPWQWFGNAFAVEPRYAFALADSMLDDGLETGRL